MATAVSATLTASFVLPLQGNREQQGEALGLGLFCLTGIGISVFSEVYQRGRRKLANYEKEQAVRNATEEAEKRFRALLTATSDAMYTMSPDWSEVRQLRSDSFVAEARTTRSDWLYKGIPIDDHPLVLAAIDEAIRMKSIFELEHRVICADGSLGWALSRAVPILGADGEITEWFGAARDITKRKKAEEALIRSEKLAATGRLAAAIAHEINNPLASAVNAVYIARSDPAQAPGMLKLAEQELSRAVHITRQALGFYRETSRQQISIPKLVDEVLLLYAAKLQNRNITITARYRCNIASRKSGCTEGCEGCEGCLRVSAGEMRQILSNLVANGIDALRDGGLMHIRVLRLPDRIQLVIADNGCGIRTENLKRVFEPFYSTKEIGTGLGLWVTQELVRKHNGVIKVRSRESKGTVFKLILTPETAPGSSSERSAPNYHVKSA